MAGFVSPIDRYVEPKDNWVECFRQEFEYRRTDIDWFLQRAAVRLGVDVRSLSWSIQKARYTGELENNEFVITCDSNQLLLPLFVSLSGKLPTDEAGLWTTPSDDSFYVVLEDSSLGLDFSYNRVSGLVGRSYSQKWVKNGETWEVGDFYNDEALLNEGGFRAVRVVHSGGLARALADKASFGYNFGGEYQQGVYFEYMLITANQ